MSSVKCCLGFVLLSGASLGFALGGEGGVTAQIEESLLSPDGILSETVRISNHSDEIIDGVILSVSARPMSYIGLTQGRMSIFPDGRGSFYLEESDGRFLLPRQDRVVKIFHKSGMESGGEGEQIELSVASGDNQMAERMIEEARLEDIFGSYTAQSREAFRELLRNTEAWKALVRRSNPISLGDGGSGVFLQSLSTAIIDEIGLIIGEALAGQENANDVIAQREVATSFVQAQKAYETGDLDLAESLLRRSLSFAPGDGLILNNLGYVLFLNKRGNASAIDYIQQALRTDPENPYYLSSLAEVLWSEGDRDEATRLIRKAKGLDTHNSSGAQELMEMWEKSD